MPAPAVRGHKVCRVHGPRDRAPKGNRNTWKHGPYSAETIAVGRLVGDMARAARETLRQ
jgi:hypothetical protein